MPATQLANGFAIRIEGVNLATSLDDETFDAIRALWMEHRVAVFPDQALDDDQLVAFTERFGPLYAHAQTSLLTTYKRKEVMELSNLDGVARPVAYLMTARKRE